MTAAQTIATEAIATARDIDAAQERREARNWHIMQEIAARITKQPAERFGWLEFLIVAPMDFALPIPFGQRPMDGVIGIAGEHEAGVDLAGSLHRAAELVSAFEQYF